MRPGVAHSGTEKTEGRARQPGLPNRKTSRKESPARKTSRRKRKPLEPALLLFLRGFARLALLLHDRHAARVFLGFHQRGELGLLTRLALGGLCGFADRALFRLLRLARFALDLQARFLESPPGSR